MNFNDSETKINLARSFAGEAQAGLRYQIVAEACLNQGYKILSDEIRKLAKNEVNHAKVLFDLITKNGGEQKNIEFTAGFPFDGTDIEAGLKAAVEAEEAEAERYYPTFSEIARKEGFNEIADKLDLIKKVEESHLMRFKYLYEAFRNGTLYKANEPTFWVCSQCGHIETKDQAWDVCPLCGATQGFVELKLP